MFMYYTKGINKNGYMLCLHCKENKNMHHIFSYIYDMTSQCDDIVLLIQEYIKVDDYNNIVGGHKHSIVLLKDNTVKCWGDNSYGQCNVPDSIQGNNHNVNINNDNVVGKVDSISSSHYYSCALFCNNTIKAWGTNFTGQCDVPDFIQGKVISTSCGLHHSCALLNDNTVKCWGNNEFGQCNVPDSIQGNNHIVNINNDNIVGKVISISCGYNHIVGLLNNNMIKCWGDNNDGQCDVPESIQDRVVSIECGAYYSIAFLNDNTIKCWGNNDFGQCDVPDSIQGKIMRKN